MLFQAISGFSPHYFAYHVLMSTVTPSRNALCPCGSGRKYKRCCGAGAAPQARNAGAALNEGMVRLQGGDLPGATRCFEEVLDRNPQDAYATYLMGVVSASRGDPVIAARWMAQALEAGLEDAAAHFQYGSVLLDLGRLEEARRQFAVAVQMRPAFVEAGRQLANCAFAAGDYPEAETGYLRLLETEPGDWRAHFNLGHALYYQLRYEEATRHFLRAAELHPEDPEVRATLATQYELMNRLEDAEREAREVLVRQPGNAGARVVLARLQRRRGEMEGALEMLDGIRPEHVNPRTRISAANERAHVLDRLGRHAEAFAAFGESKQLLAEMRRIQYRPDQWEGPLATAEAYFTPERWAVLQSLAAQANDSRPRALFVVGFHRSGSTLLEQMLASHPDITGAGETGLLERLEQRLSERLDAPYPQCLDHLDAQDATRVLGELRDAYLEEARARAPDVSGKAWLVDKSLFNILHLPLLRLLFPDAPLIRVVRHPLDTVLSCFFQNFLDRNEWSYGLEDAARFYARVHDHVQSIAPVLKAEPSVVRYEALVEDPEGVLGDVLGRLDLPWDARCLEFYRSEHLAQTASYAQVREPLNTRSRDRHRRYLPWIDDRTRAVLAPVLEQLGYDPV
jgi:tetratricopeptide (TPR) repeat protein